MIGPDGGRTSLSSWRIAERWIGSRSSLAPGVCSATAPTTQARPRPRQASSAAPPRPSSTPRLLAEPVAQVEAQDLEPGGEDAAQEERAHEGEQGGVLGVGALRQQQGRQARSGECADDETDQRQRADDQALHVAPDGHQEREADDDPVDGSHARERYTRHYHRFRASRERLDDRAPLAPDSPRGSPPRRGRGRRAACGRDRRLRHGLRRRADRRRLRAGLGAPRLRAGCATCSTDDSKARWTTAALRRRYSAAADTATATEIRVGDPRGERDGAVRLPVAVSTRVFGVVRGEVLVPVEGDAVTWAPRARVSRVSTGARS